jgi:hypothetical protein
MTRPQRIVEYCRDVAGDSLRAVFEYGDDGPSLRYAAGSTLEFPDDAAALCHTARQTHDALAAAGANSTALESPTASVHAFEGALVVQLPVAEDCGCLVVLDPEAGRNLVDFVEGCHRQWTRERAAGRSRRPATPP